jgi:hypothetical protein
MLDGGTNAMLNEVRTWFAELFDEQGRRSFLA